MPLYQFRKDRMERTFLFVHIPKTGGTAIEAYLKSAGLAGFFDPPSYMPVRPYLKVPPAHYDYAYLRRLFNLDSLYSFAVVRHPVSRLISEYQWAREKTTISAPLAQMGFSEFIRYMFEQYRRDEDIASGHFKPQVRFVGDKLSKIFKYESGLENVIGQVFRDIGLDLGGPVKLPVVNRSTKAEIKATKADIELIQQVYAEDFSAFSYSAEAFMDEGRA